jgi:hypothetical protein
LSASDNRLILYNDVELLQRGGRGGVRGGIRITPPVRGGAPGGRGGVGGRERRGVARSYQAAVQISVQAVDNLDIFVRFWDFWFDKMPGSYLGGGKYTTPPDVSEVHVQGQTMTISAPLSAGSHDIYFAITQTGGSSYGTYSGTMLIGGTSSPFSGVDFANPLRISYTVAAGPSPPAPTPPPTVIPPPLPFPITPPSPPVAPPPSAPVPSPPVTVPSIPPKILGLKVWQIGVIGLVVVVALASVLTLVRRK